MPAGDASGLAAAFPAGGFHGLVFRVVRLAFDGDLGGVFQSAQCLNGRLPVVRERSWPSRPQPAFGVFEDDAARMAEFRVVSFVI